LAVIVLAKAGTSRIINLAWIEQVIVRSLRRIISGRLRL